MTSAGTVEWYLRRLAVMSPAEVLHRLGEQARKRASRWIDGGWSRFEHVGDGPLTAVAPFSRLADIAWPDDVARSVEQAAEARNLEFLGQRWSATAQLYTTPGIFTLDPHSGEAWPGIGTFCFDVEWRREQVKGDVKFVLELNRLQSLHAVAALALRDRDAVAAKAAADLIVLWMKANPPFQGVNWLSMIELSLRLVTVAMVVAALEATGQTGTYRETLRRFVAAHAHWLHRFPSLHSSANNHRVAEGLGLFIAAQLMPDLPEALMYRRVGQFILVEAAGSQFHSDGTGVEQSPTYAAFTLEMILLGIELARATDQPFSAEIERQLTGAASFLRTLLDEGGQAPRIGDDDEGRVLATPPQHEDRYVASVVAAAAGTLGRPDLSPPARSPHLRDLVFSAPSTPSPRGDSLTCFKVGGYSVARETLAGRRVMFVFDHGPLGLAPLAAHGHADALSVWLHIDNCPVLVDPGTLRYHAMQNWRDWLRSTPAHNTLTIAGQSQSVPAGPFNWRQQASSRLLSVREGNDWEVVAEHDGYSNRFGCVHRRWIKRHGNVVAIADALHGGARQQDARISFLFHPALAVTTSTPNSIIVARAGVQLLRMSWPASSSHDLISTRDLLEANAYSPRYNHLVAATRIILRPASFDQTHTVQLEILAE